MLRNSSSRVCSPRSVSSSSAQTLSTCHSRRAHTRPPPLNDVITMLRFTSLLTHEIAIMCSCPSCNLPPLQKHTQHVCPAGVGPRDYVIDIEWMGWRQLGSLWLFFLASYSDVISGCSHRLRACVPVCVSWLVWLCVETKMTSVTIRFIWRLLSLFSPSAFPLKWKKSSQFIVIVLSSLLKETRGA